MGLFKLNYIKIYRYPQYPIFKRVVINKGIVSINELSELDVSLSVVGKMGRVHTLRFSYTESKQGVLQF